MTPISCFLLASDVQFVGVPGALYQGSCFFSLKGSNAYGVPVFNHFGYTNQYPSYCSCDNGAGPGATNDNCNVFDLMVGFLVYNPTKYNPNFEFDNPYMDLVYNMPVSNISYSAYNAMYAAMQTNFTANSTFRENAYAFCNSSWATCSLVTLEVYDDINRAVSDYYYELAEGSCRNTMTIPNPQMDMLQQTPPAPLQQSYYNCVKSKTTTLVDSVGVSVGNASAILPFCFLFFVNVYLFIQRFEGKDVRITYTKEERDDALQALAVQLLMMRDNRLPNERKKHSQRLVRNSRDNSASDAHTHGRATEGLYYGHDATDLRNYSPKLHDDGTESILRTLTDELMENAYVSTYFTDESQTPIHIRSESSANPMQVDVEMGIIPKKSSVGRKINVLNSSVDTSIEAVQAYKSCDSNNAVLGIFNIVDDIQNRMVKSVENNSEENFWDVAVQTAVLRYVDLNTLFEASKSDRVRCNQFNSLVLKICQLMQAHIK